MAAQLTTGTPGGSPTEPDLHLTADGRAEDRAAISAGLSAFNESRAGPLDARALAVLLRSASGETVGGLWGRTYWRWLYVELLFVPDALRGRDLGSRLIAVAEGEARNRGCVGAWLDTFAFQAPGFYERLGYERFGTIADFPPGADRIFFSKRL